MAEQEGFVKVDRNMLHWRWMTEPLTAHLFMVMLLKANYKDLRFKGRLIPKGSFVTSYHSLCISSGLSLQECRTAMKRLKSTGEITSEANNQYQVITIVNYKQYQNLTSKLTAKQHASNMQLTCEQQQVKNIKEYGKKEERKKKESLRSDSPSGEIPEMYRDQFATYDDYLAWRNQ